VQLCWAPCVTVLPHLVHVQRFLGSFGMTGCPQLEHWIVRVRHMCAIPCVTVLPHFVHIQFLEGAFDWTCSPQFGHGLKISGRHIPVCMFPQVEHGIHTCVAGFPHFGQSLVSGDSMQRTFAE